MPGLAIAQGSSDAWPEMGAQAERAFNSGFVLDQTADGAGAFTTRATFATSLTFTVVGDQTATYVAGRRLQVIHAGGTTYCQVLSAVYGGVNTTVTITHSTSGPGIMTTPITSVAFAPSFGGNLGNEPSTADRVFMNLWGL